MQTWFWAAFYSDLCSLRATGPADGPSTYKQYKSWTCTEVFKCRILNTWILSHREAMASACRTASSEQSFLWNVLLCLFSLSQLHFCPPTSCFIHHVQSPFRPHYASLLSLACSCPAQTRAKRLILALRPSELSQLSPFSPLSVSISSNTLPGCCYGHQRAGWYFWPLCVRN